MTSGAQIAQMPGETLCAVTLAPSLQDHILLFMNVLSLVKQWVLRFRFELDSQIV